MNKIKSKKSQVTIFIIAAIIIIALLVIFFSARVRNLIIPTKSGSPVIQLQDCIKSDMATTIADIAGKGGSVNPANYYMYENRKVEYLCYTNQYYQTCVMQQPLLKQHFEREILDAIKPKLTSCIQNLKNTFSDRGYSVNGAEQVSIDTTQNSINLVVSGMTISKEDSGEKYSQLTLTYSSKMYNLLMITTSILNWEARYGDSETTTYMLYYPNIKVEKLKQSDGSKIYILTDTSSNEIFTFATRSLSWPGGYSVDEIYTPVK